MELSSPYTASNVAEAQLIADVLRAAGLQVHLEGTPVVPYGMVPIGVRVWVPMDSAEQAAGLVRAWLQRGASAET